MVRLKRGMKRNGFDIYFEESDMHKHSWKVEAVEYLIECFCMLFLIYGCVYGLFATCEVSAVQGTTLFVSAVIVLVTFGVLSYEKNRFYLIGYFVICMVLLLLYNGVILHGARYFAAYYAKKMNIYFGLNLMVSIIKSQEVYSPELYISFFQIFLIWVITFLVGIVRKIYKKSLLALISPVLIFSLIFIVGLIPAPQFLFTFLIGFLPLSLSCKGKDTTVRIHAKLTTLASTGVLVLMFFCFLPRTAVNKNIPQIISMREDIQNTKESSMIETLKYYLSDFKGNSNGIFIGGYSGKTNGVLGEKDSITYDGKTDFVLTTDLRDFDYERYDIYLRSYVGDNYRDRGWKGLDKEQQEAYSQLTKKYDYNFESLLTDAFQLKNSFDYNGFDETYMYYGNYKIEKKRVGRKCMLLPYGLKESVKSRKGMLYTEHSDKKRVYTEVGTKLALFPFDTHNSTGFDMETVASVAPALMSRYDEPDDESFPELVGDDKLNFIIESAKDTGSEENHKKLEQHAKRETSYRRFVYDTYTKVPEGVAPRLREVVKKIPDTSDGMLKGHNPYESGFIDYYNCDQIEYLIYQCTRFVIGNAEYSLSPGKTPENKDFVDYFLFENKKGYCTHFATAAAIYLRLAGVPARYVEGYKIPSTEVKQVQKRTKLDGKDAYRVRVTDEKAHAWVEVYLNGVGWIPIEFTPGIGRIGAFKQKVETKQTASPSPSVSLSLKPSHSKEQVTKHPDLPSEQMSVKGHGSKGDVKDLRRAIRVILKILLVAFALFAITVLRWCLIHNMKRRRESGQKNNDKAKFYYHEVDKISKLLFKKEIKKEQKNWILELTILFKELSKEELEQFITIVEKATFGSGQISDYECTKCVTLYQKVRKQLYLSNNIVKKLYYYAWKVL